MNKYDVNEILSNFSSLEELTEFVDAVNFAEDQALAGKVALAGAGALGGAALGALVDLKKEKKKRKTLRNALIGALIGGGLGYGASYIPGVGEFSNNAVGKAKGLISTDSSTNQDAPVSPEDAGDSWVERAVISTGAGATAAAAAGSAAYGIGKRKGWNSGAHNAMRRGREVGEGIGFDNGKNEGLDIGRMEGKVVGRREGYRAGHDRGYEFGHEIGEIMGRHDGRVEGYMKGEYEGRKTGYEAGEKAGRAAGFERGKFAGRFEEGIRTMPSLALPGPTLREVEREKWTADFKQRQARGNRKLQAILKAREAADPSLRNTDHNVIEHGYINPETNRMNYGGVEFEPHSGEFLDRFDVDNFIERGVRIKPEWAPHLKFHL